MTLLAVLTTLILLVLLITWAKLHPFLAFLVASIAGALLLGIPPASIPDTLEKGIGGTLGGLIIIICLGAMFGKLIAESGAAQKISEVLLQCFGRRHITWALMLTGFIVGIPLFYNVGFVLLVPLVFSVMYQSGLPAVYLGIPLLAALSVTHGYLPPHPSPTALIPLFGADIGKTLLYGLCVAIPSMILAGPLLAKRLRHIECTPLKTFVAAPRSSESLPGGWNSFTVALLPILLIATSTLLAHLNIDSKALGFLGNANIVMLIALALASYTLALRRGMSMQHLMQIYTEAVKDISIILLIVAGAGTLKQVFVDSGVSASIAALLTEIPINPLILAWLIATCIRISLGSATVAGLTAAGIVAPLASEGYADPNLLVLAVGAGSLMCSHVNDSGFWMFKEYFNLSLKDTFKSWTLMETIVGVVGLAVVLALDALR